MNDEDSRRGGRAGGIFVALVVGGSAVGVIGWYVITNRNGPAIDATGFDMSVAPQSRRSAAVAPAGRSGESASSLSMLKSDPGVRIGDSNPAAAGQSPSAKAGDKKEQAHTDFTDQARKHEADVRRFAEKMTKRYPIFRQYAKDWMSHPDLRKLNDDYMRNHDPVAFILGLTRAPSLGGMVKQYAGSPAIMAFITEGMKEAPGELTSSAMDVLANDTVAKGLIANVAGGLGLPPSITGMITSAGGAPGAPAKIDQNKVISDIMNSPAAQNAMKQQGPQTLPVSLPNQQ